WGLFSDSFVPKITALPSVREVTVRTMEWADGATARPGVPDASLNFTKIEVTGIDPAHETHFRTHKVVQGRMLTADDQHAIVAEEALAKELGFALGDTLRIRQSGEEHGVESFRVVGLIDRRRAAAQQLPMIWANIADVQRQWNFPGKIKGLDVMLRN